jgi:hypothetical protein
MDPNLKLMFEEFVKQVCDQIRDGFATHESIINNRLFEFALMDQRREEHVASLESVAVAFDKSFREWKPEVDSSMSAVRLELSKLNTFFDCDANSSSTPKPGVLSIGSTTAQPAASGHPDGPNGHRVESSHRDRGFGRVYTQTHDLVTSTVLPSPQIPLIYTILRLFLIQILHSPCTITVRGLA